MREEGKNREGRLWKILVTIICIIITCIILYFLYVKPTMVREELNKKFAEFKKRYEEKKAQGYDVAEAEAFIRKAKHAFETNKYEEAEKFLEKAFKLLEIASPPISTKAETICMDGKDNDGDGFTDDEDGDCWIREGALFEMIQQGKEGTLSFKEQEEMLPLLAEMGIKTIYLTPIWRYKQGTSLRRYCIQDYYQIDSAKGTAEDFKHFVETAHSYGIKVILDMVTAHTSPGRYIYEHHKDWILRDKYGNLVYCWPSKHWGYAVDRSNPEVIDYFTKIAKFYIDNYGIDGWRMDAIGTQYCTSAVEDCPQPVEGEHNSKNLLKSIKSAIGNDKVLYLEWHYLGRVYLLQKGVEEEGGCPVPNPIPCSVALPELNEFAEASYSYEFGKCFIPNILTGKVSSQDLVNFFKDECTYYGKARGRFLMTHDFGFKFYMVNKRFHKPGAILITTVPGFPHIYHREIFPQGDIAPINREMFDFYKKLLSIRSKYPALRYGSIENVWAGGDNTLAYMREYDEEKVVIVINFQGRNVTSILNLPFPEGSTLIDVLNNESFYVKNPKNFEISIPAYTGRILILEKK